MNSNDSRQIEMPPTQTGYDLTGEGQSTSSISEIVMKTERANSIDDNVNVKLENVATQLDSVVEILSSIDGEDIDELQNKRLRTVKIELEDIDSMNGANGNDRSGEVPMKEEFDIEPKQEVIDEDIPIRRFNPNDVSSNDGYSTSNDAAKGNGAGSFLRLEEDEEKPSCSKDSKRFNCELCKYGTDCRGNFNVHIRTHTNEKPFRCSRCFKHFAHSRSLKSHMATHKNEFSFHCSNCFRGFFQSGEKVAHEKNCTNRRYECFICKYVTIQKTHLVRHMRTHSGNKPYRCSRCSKGFTQFWHLKMHITTHKDRKLPFYCKGCFRRFPKESEKKAHEKTCRNRRYECGICKKYVTGNKTQMEIHMRSHTGEKPFRCEVCMKRFTQKHHLKRHLNNIHNRRNL